jgi:hypothetical protein
MANIIERPWEYYEGLEKIHEGDMYEFALFNPGHYSAVQDAVASDAVYSCRYNFNSKVAIHAFVNGVMTAQVCLNTRIRILYRLLRAAK